MEEMLKKIEMGFDPQISLAQMNKDGNVEDGLRGQVVCLNPLVKKKATEKVRGRNPETSQDEIFEHDGFLGSLARRCIP